MRLRLPLAASLLAALPTTAAAEPAQVVYASANNVLRVAALDGTQVRQGAAGDGQVSTSGGLVLRGVATGGLRSDVVADDAVTGARRWRIHDALFPLAYANGRFVVFTGDRDGAGRGDRGSNNVWLWDVAHHRGRRIAQFGGGVLADLTPLNYAVSPTGRLVAITEGNDADLLHFEIWVARTDGRGKRRLVPGSGEIYPAFSPNGQRVVYAHRNAAGTCWTLRLVNTGGGPSHAIPGSRSCSTVLFRPVWTDAGHVVAWSWHASTPTGLVSLDVATGARTTLLTGPVQDFTVSRPLHTLAAYLQGGRVVLVDLTTGTARDVPGATTAGDAGRVWIAGALEYGY
jgi:hypothetical protein